MQDFQQSSLWDHALDGRQLVQTESKRTQTNKIKKHQLKWEDALPGWNVTTVQISLKLNPRVMETDKIERPRGIHIFENAWNKFM